MYNNNMIITTPYNGCTTSSSLLTFNITTVEGKQTDNTTLVGPAQMV